MLKSKLTRRRLLATAAASVIAMPYVRGAHAAGKLSVGFWDHWVPGANTASQKLCEEWAAKEKVDLAIDYITSQGNKNLVTIAAEAQARSGHDIFQFPSWQPADHANRLEPVDDIMTELIKQNGAVNPTVEYLAKSTGRWVAVPAAVGSQIKGPCSRIDLMKKHAGIDVQAMYPAGSPAKADAWTLDAMLKAAEACYKAGYPFGIGLGVTEDNVDTAGAIFQSFGANHERAGRLGGRKARCAADRRAIVAARHAGRPQGALCALPALFLRHLELRPEQVRGQEPARLPLAAVGGREDGGDERRLRPAGVREVHDVQDLGRGGTAEEHALPLSQSPQSPDSLSCGAARAAEDRRADLYPGDPHQDGGALNAGGAARTDARLGGNRGRRLHADLKLPRPRRMRSVRAMRPIARRGAPSRG